MRYDVERMKREISMPSLIRYICDSSEIHKAGTTMFCRCVSGLHQESQYNHNAVYEKKRDIRLLRGHSLKSLMKLYM